MEAGPEASRQDETAVRWLLGRSNPCRMTFSVNWKRQDTTNLLFSADGQRWNRQAAVPLLGSYIHSIAVGNTEVIVATTSHTGTNQLWLGTLDQ